MERVFKRNSRGGDGINLVHGFYWDLNDNNTSETLFDNVHGYDFPEMYNSFNSSTITFSDYANNLRSAYTNSTEANLPALVTHHTNRIRP